MPRKKTIQPEPIERFTLEDGTIVEVRDMNTWEIGRGLHMQRDHELLRGKILAWVADIYLSPQDPKVVKDDFLKSASAFDIALQKSGHYPKELAGDDGPVRKRIYPYVIKHIAILKKLVEEKKKT